jgi:hypothetical protein
MTQPPTAAPEVEQPRDRNGRIVRLGALVSVWGGGRATVESYTDDGQIVVTRSDGKTLTVDAARVTVLRDVAPAPEPEEIDEPETPGDDEPEEGAEDEAEAEADAPAGTSPAPDAQPDGDVVSVLFTPDRTQQAWLVMEDGEPVGYLRPDVNDEASTVRYDDSAQWAEEMDRLDMVNPDLDPVPPEDTAAVAATEPPADDDDTSPAEMRSEPGRQGVVAAPDVLDAFYGGGLVVSETDDGAVQAHAEAVDEIVARLDHLDETVYLSAEQASILAQIEAEEIVYLRMPRRGYDGEYVYTEFDRGWYERARSRRPMPEDAEVVTAPMLRTLALRDAVNAVLATWSTTTNGEHPMALALQEVAVETFGMDAPEGWDDSDVYGLRERTEAAREDHGDLLAEVLTAMYDLTQERLREQGITSLHVLRGYKVYDETPDWLAPAVEGGEVSGEMPLRPLTSFTTDPAKAGTFARGRSTADGYVIEGTVPVERVVATPRTGVGCLAEREVVVMAGPGDWTIRRATQYDGPAEADGFNPHATGWDADEVEDEWDDQPSDPATLPVGLLADDRELAAAVAAAGPDEADNARRAALVDRAAAMGRLDLIPTAWQGDGSVVEAASGASEVMTEVEYDQRVIAVEGALAAAVDAGLMTDVTETIDVDRRIYSPERADVHKQLIEALYGSAEDIATDGRAMLLGGLPGHTGLDALRRDSEIADERGYARISTEEVLVAMAEADLIPEVPDLSPMEASALAHEEAEHVAYLLAGRAMADRRNILWDIAMTDHEAISSRVAALHGAGYGVVEGVFADIDIETSVERTRDAHWQGTDRWRMGDGHGGRYLPAVAIRAHKDADWASSNRAAFEDAKDQFTQWAVYDCNAPGTPPTRTSTSRGFGLPISESTREQEHDA